MIIDVSARNFVLQCIDVKSLKLEESSYMFLLIKAEWCVFCNQYDPIYAKYSTEFPKTHFLRLEATAKDNAEMLKQWGQLAWPIVPTRNGTVQPAEGDEPAFYNPKKTLGFPTVVLYSGSGVPLRVVDNRFDLVGALANIQKTATAA